MAYIGPVSRGKRAPAAAPSSTGASRARVPSTSATPRFPGISADGTNTGPKIFALGMLTGAAVGAGLALLFAPQAGDDTRRALTRRLRRARRSGQDAWEDLRGELDRVRRRRRRKKRAARERQHADEVEA